MPFFSKLWGSPAPESRNTVGSPSSTTNQTLPFQSHTMSPATTSSSVSYDYGLHTPLSTNASIADGDLEDNLLSPEDIERAGRSQTSEDFPRGVMAHTLRINPVKPTQSKPTQPDNKDKPAQSMKRCREAVDNFLMVALIPAFLLIIVIYHLNSTRNTKNTFLTTNLCPKSQNQINQRLQWLGECVEAGNFGPESARSDIVLSTQLKRLAYGLAFVTTAAAVRFCDSIEEAKIVFSVDSTAEANRKAYQGWAGIRKQAAAVGDVLASLLCLLLLAYAWVMLYQWRGYAASQMGMSISKLGWTLEKVLPGQMNGTIISKALGH